MGGDKNFKDAILEVESLNALDKGFGDSTFMAGIGVEDIPLGLRMLGVVENYVVGKSSAASAFGKVFSCAWLVIGLDLWCRGFCFSLRRGGWGRRSVRPW